MSRLLRSPFLAALLGGLIAAGALLATDSAFDDPATTVVQQAPLAASDVRGGDSSGLTPRQIYERNAAGVVFVRAQTVERRQSPFDLFPREERGEATGSGFVIDDEGFIVTNAHVINSASQVQVQFGDDQVRPARVVGKDESTDLALLKIDPKGLELRPLTLGDSSRMRVGDPTIAIGNPFGLDRTLTTGVVSALQRRIEAPNGFAIEDVIQTDAAINPGNSGGPLLDATGRVIGINSQIATGGGGGNVGIGFAVPVNTAKQVIPQLKDAGRVQRAYLGISGLDITPRLSALKMPAEKGVLIQSVNPDSPADRAGLRAGNTQVELDGETVIMGGDVIQKVDGRPVSGMDEVVRAVSERKPDEKLELTILRDGKSRTVEVKLGTRPDRIPDSP